MYLDPEIFALDSGASTDAGGRQLLGDARGAGARDRPGRRLRRSCWAGCCSGRPPAPAARHRSASACAAAADRGKAASDASDDRRRMDPARRHALRPAVRRLERVRPRLDMPSWRRPAVSLRSGEFVVVTVGAAFGGLLVGYAVFGSRGSRVGVGGVSGLAPTAVLKVASWAPRGEAPRTAPRRARRSSASSLRAGHSFLQALDTVAEGDRPARRRPSSTGSWRRCVSAAARRTRWGRSPNAWGARDFKWAVLAVNIQREVGGNLAEILDNVADTLRERATMRRPGPRAHLRGPPLGVGAGVDAVRDRALHVRGEQGVHHAAGHRRTWAGSCCGVPGLLTPASSGCGRS